MDMVTVIARFSPYESVAAVRRFVADCFAEETPVPADLLMLFKYTASQDKSRNVLSWETAQSVLLTGEVPSALSQCSDEEPLGTSGLAPAGTIVVVWPPDQLPSGLSRGQYLKSLLFEKLPKNAADQVRASPPTRRPDSSPPPARAGCCSVS